MYKIDNCKDYYIPMKNDGEQWHMLSENGKVAGMLDVVFINYMSYEEAENVIKKAKKRDNDLIEIFEVF